MRSKARTDSLLAPHSSVYVKLHSHDFLVLGSQHIVNLLDILVMHFLQLGFRVLLFIFRHTVLHCLFQGIDWRRGVRYVR